MQAKLTFLAFYSLAGCRGRAESQGCSSERTDRAAPSNLALVGSVRSTCCCTCSRLGRLPGSPTGQRTKLSAQFCSPRGTCEQHAVSAPRSPCAPLLRSCLRSRGPAGLVVFGCLLVPPYCGATMGSSSSAGRNDSFRTSFQPTQGMEPSSRPFQVLLLPV